MLGLGLCMGVWEREEGLEGVGILRMTVAGDGRGWAIEGG